MTDYTRQFVEHHPENYQRKHKCPWCEQRFVDESELDCPHGCGHSCLCGQQATGYVDIFGAWMCDSCRNRLGREINSFGGGD